MYLALTNFINIFVIVITREDLYTAIILDVFVKFSAKIKNVECTVSSLDARDVLKVVSRILEEKLKNRCVI
jgi:hypothetical protein